MEIQAAVLREHHGDFAIQTVELDALRDDEALIEIAATGLCHTDLVVRDGIFPMPALPAILGHEGAGVVAAAGAGVRSVAVGDHVVLSFASCGGCPDCEAGRPARCGNFVSANFLGKRPDGSVTHRHKNQPINASFFGQSSFATHALVRECSIVKVPSDLPIELLGPLGCGIQTGAGTVLNHLKPQAATSIAIFGAGAVGLSAVMAARIAGCGVIIAADVHAGRLAVAAELGATHTFDCRDGDVVARIREITGAGADYVIEGTGAPDVVAQSLRCVRRRGDVALLGLGRQDAPLPITLGDLMTGTVIRSVTEGDSVPAQFIPELIGLYRQGRFPFDRLITFYPLDQINEAVRAAISGDVIKPVIRMPRPSQGTGGA
jgi:aryl-alcohol dehydrogenase